SCENVALIIGLDGSELSIIIFVPACTESIPPPPPPHCTFNIPRIYEYKEVGVYPYSNACASFHDIICAPPLINTTFIVVPTSSNFTLDFSTTTSSNVFPENLIKGHSSVTVV